MKAAIPSPCKKIIFLLAIVSLASCVTVDAEPQVTHQTSFVTATLPPTKAGLAQATSLPSPETTAEPSLTPVTTSIPLLDCKDAAVLLRDVTIPDNTQVKAGEKLIKTWEFQNTGTCPWINYKVEFSTGDEINAPLSTPMPATAPNEKVQVSMELIAPSADGRYEGYFTLNNSNSDVVPIGTEKTFWVKFMVGTYASIPTNPAPSGNCVYGPNAEYVNQIASLINTARTNAGLSTLTFNTEIAAFAQSHAEDMALNNFLSHDGSDGSFGERMAGYSMTHPGTHLTGEILAIGTPQYAIDQWQTDEHWDYVLGSFTQFGVGYAYNSCSDHGGYFTVDFSE
jgi:uncharacterized protein YkwD